MDCSQAAIAIRAAQAAVDLRACNKTCTGVGRFSFIERRPTERDPGRGSTFRYPCAVRARPTLTLATERASYGWQAFGLNASRERGVDAGSRLLPPGLEDCRNGRTVARTTANMMEPDDACRVDENIAAELKRVAARVFRQAAARELLEVSDPRPGSPDVPKTPPIHAVATVQRAIAVDEYGPAQFHFGHVRSGDRRSLERHDRGLYSQIPERLLLLLQLQQVPAAGESTKVPVKDQQEPVSPIVAEPMRAPFSVR